MSEPVVIQCAQCHGTGTKGNGEQCLCYLFGGPVKRFDGDHWEVKRND